MANTLINKYLPLRALLWCVAICCILGLDSCKKKQQGVVAREIADTASLDSAKVFRPVVLSDSMAKQLKPTYTVCKGKVQATFSIQEQSFSSTVKFTSIRGKETTFLATGPLGIPLATGWLRPDSIAITVKITGQKIKEPLSKLSQLTGLPADLGVVEAVLTGQYTIPQGFVPVFTTDSSIIAYPLPDDSWKLQMLFKQHTGWPTNVELRDAYGSFTIQNTETAPFPGPRRTVFVQADSLGKVLTTLKLEAQSRKFE